MNTRGMIGSGVNWRGFVEIYVINLEISQDTRKRVLKQDFEQLKEILHMYRTEKDASSKRSTISHHNN
jgi:hypothetical protein